ncbi:MAG TPA: hypothetical protein VHC86_04255 [Opitutaceae bacterium]|nr:hypothetical protein [Opitutaceae bacterium]
MPAEPEKRPLEAEDGDSNVSYRPAGEAKPEKNSLQPGSVAPTDPKGKQRPASGSETGGQDDARRARILKTERYGPTSGKL